MLSNYMREQCENATAKQTLRGNEMKQKPTVETYFKLNPPFRDIPTGRIQKDVGKLRTAIHDLTKCDVEDKEEVNYVISEVEYYESVLSEVMGTVEVFVELEEVYHKVLDLLEERMNPEEREEFEQQLVMYELSNPNKANAKFIR